MRTVIFLGCLVLSSTLLACGSEGGPTGPDFPSVNGSYGGSWTLRATEVSSGASVSASCPGSVTISNQTGGSFSGSFLMQQTVDCDPLSGNVTGTVRVDGGVTFQVDVPGGNPNEFEDLTGCTVVSGDNAFSGNVAGNQMTVSAGLITDCTVNFTVIRINWTIGFAGTR